MEGMTQGPIHWTASDGMSGTADLGYLWCKSGVLYLTPTQPLALINTNHFHQGWLWSNFFMDDGIRKVSDLLDTYNSKQQVCY